ncbi:MAG: SAM-dependent methyltransferase [Candidatus Kerfeldbacteria bacterium]|nr:SAM-dependent methyltransferase [Candidatus Kerfeldbacteria bacterium]
MNTSLLSFLIIFSVFLLTPFLAAISLAPWVPMRSRDLKRVFELARLQPREVFYDLGCGNGKTVVYAARHFRAKATGIELALPLYIICLLHQLLNWRFDIHFRWGNLFRHNISDANVVYIFGMPNSLAKKLKQKLLAELKPGTRVITYTFPIAGLTPSSVDKPTEKDLPIYLYIL